MTLHPRIRTCVIHHLRPRCPACEGEQRPGGVWVTQDVPRGFAIWLREAAKFYDSLGPISATEFAEAISCDLRETRRATMSEAGLALDQGPSARTSPAAGGPVVIR